MKITILLILLSLTLSLKFTGVAYAQQSPADSCQAIKEAQAALENDQRTLSALNTDMEGRVLAGGLADVMIVLALAEVRKHLRLVAAEARQDDYQIWFSGAVFITGLGVALYEEQKMAREYVLNRNAILSRIQSYQAQLKKCENVATESFSQFKLRNLTFET